MKSRQSFNTLKPLGAHFVLNKDLIADQCYKNNKQHFNIKEILKGIISLDIRSSETIAVFQQITFPDLLV